MIQRRSFLQQIGGSAAFSLLASSVSQGAKKSATTPAAAALRFGDGRDWFFEKRFGMFVHWGIYSILGWHEQHQWRGRIPRKEYVKLAERWNPAKFDPKQWLDLLEEAGMKYLIVTTKHHYGFCLFDSKLTQFTTIHTPCKKDIIGMLSEACHKRKLPLCLYYSIADWNHPNYPNQGGHHELPKPEEGDQSDWNDYLEFLKGRVRELCANYGRIHGFWWGMNVPEHVDPAISAMIRQLQPDVVINDRGFDKGDFGTPERDYKEDYYTVGHLERSITRYLAHGANYLLDVGPRPDGTIDPRSTAILKEIGRWMKAVGESYGDATPASHLSDNHNVMLTRRENSLYVHLHTVPMTDSVKLKPFTSAPKRAVLLNNGTELPLSTALCPIDHQSQTGYLRVRGIPAASLANTVGVIRLDFENLEAAAERPAPRNEDGIRTR